jgi:hypothetical protein
MRCPALAGGAARRARLARTGRYGRFPRAGRGAGPPLRGPRWPPRCSRCLGAACRTRSRAWRRRARPPRAVGLWGPVRLGRCVTPARASGRVLLPRIGLCRAGRFRCVGLGCDGCRFRCVGLGCVGLRRIGLCRVGRFRCVGLGCDGCRFRCVGLAWWARLGGARPFVRRAGVGDRFGRGRADESVRSNLTGRRSRPSDVGRAGLRVVPDLTGRRPSVCVDNARHNAYPRCTALPVINRRDILTAALLRARLPGEWSRAPVANSR